MRTLLAATLALTCSSAAFSAEKVDFRREIQPLLAEHCLRCHGPEKAEASLNLRERTSALAALESGGQAIVPGDAAASELVKRIKATNADERMPPDKPPLKAKEIELLQRWITEGADYQKHWSLEPVLKPAPPEVKNAAWPKNDLDRFILAELEKRNIAPSPEPDRYTLIKRLYYDLWGLPPSREEVQQFVADGNYEALIDRLLASPHFGERWGRHWLDKARYADSDGYEKDKARPDAYVYRDWVIEAYNRDLPFDQFTIQQLAGDLLPGAGSRGLLATAFNRQTLTNEEGGVDQEEYRVNAVFDRTETLGIVWLGLTVGCARCHTHKYDPLTHREYYQLFAFFNGADETNAKVVVKATNLAEYEAKAKSVQERMAARRAEISPQQQEWERAAREKLLAVAKTELALQPLSFSKLQSAAGLEFAAQNDGSLLVGPASTSAASSGEGKAAAAETDTYTLESDFRDAPLTGLKLEAIPDPSLPGQGAGRSKNGNFVVSALRLNVVDAEGKPLRSVALQRPKASFEQKGYPASAAIAEKPDGKTGWAVMPQMNRPQSLEVRTKEPLSLTEGERWQIVIEQQHGKEHLLGRFKVSAITGDERGLDLPDNIASALEMYPEKRVAATKAALFDYFAAQDEQLQSLDAELKAIDKEYQAQTMSVRTIGKSLRGRKTKRFERGDFLSPAEEVAPQTPAVLPPLVSEEKRPANRLDLAQWLVSKENPLTPRVAANQIWAHLFGAGIVRSTNDFGVRGEPPTNPALLDWLAATYRDDCGWSTKALLKTILMSATYRQSSQHRPELAETDPLNTLLARQNRLRVEGEIVRDLALSASGLLSPKVGGPSVFPPMPPDVAKLSYANNFSWAESKGEDRYRRGMYTFFKRTIPHPMLMTFDCPDANVAVSSRTVSNTPLQALTLLNNDSFHEAAQALAQRTLLESGANDQERLTRAWQTCLIRPPQAGELEPFAKLLADARTHYASHEAEAKKLIGERGAKGIAPAENAAWVATLRVLLNLDEFITRE